MARREARQAQKPEEAAHAQRYWTARKQELGLTPAMDHGARIQRISEASEVHRRTQEAERQILMRGREAMTEEEAQARLQRHQAQTMELRALRQAEEHYSKHSQELRTPSHLAAIAKVLHDDDQEHGRVRRRGRSREDEQDRTRTHVREW
jgi:translation initiation factor IF-3